MNTLEKSPATSAGVKLSIIDVILFQAKFDRPNDAVPGEHGWQQHKRGVHHAIEESGEGGNRELHVVVNLGTRVLNAESGESEPGSGAVQFEIEATYVVRYRMLEQLDEDALDAFAQFNSVHNVWPFWRQHVFDIVQRARLPHLEVPLFAGTAP